MEIINFEDKKKLKKIYTVLWNVLVLLRTKKNELKKINLSVGVVLH